VAAKPWGGGVPRSNWIALFAAASTGSASARTSDPAGHDVPVGIAPDTPIVAETAADGVDERGEATGTSGAAAHPTRPELDDGLRAEPPPVSAHGFPEPRPPHEHGAIPWLDRRLHDLGLRLEQRLFTNPELRRHRDEWSRGPGSLQELQRQELDQRLFDAVRSEFTDMARAGMDPLRSDVREALLEGPFIRMFTLDSSYRHPTEGNAASESLPVGDGAASVTVVRSSRSSAQHWVQSLADRTSQLVPGDVDFKASVSLRRLRLGASLQPWAEADAPGLLRGFTIKASREYQDYFGAPDVVDRVGCWMDCFATRQIHGRLFVERQRGDVERATLVGFNLVCRF